MGENDWIVLLSLLLMCYLPFLWTSESLISLHVYMCSIVCSGTHVHAEATDNVGCRSSEDRHHLVLEDSLSMKLGLNDSSRLPVWETPGMLVSQCAPVLGLQAQTTKPGFFHVCSRGLTQGKRFPD